MGKWLDRLREHEKNKQERLNGADKIDKIPSGRAGRAGDEAERFEERAAVLEFDHGMPREEAERLAYLQTSNTIH